MRSIVVNAFGFLDARPELAVMGLESITRDFKCYSQDLINDSFWTGHVNEEISFEPRMATLNVQLLAVIRKPLDLADITLSLVMFRGVNRRPTGN